jgi:catechol 2,3-dioxygenase-like lactoylglutathione lyase family enzyme
MILEHVAIAVSKLERSIGFYEGLGFRLLRRTPTNAFMYLDDAVIELIQGDLQSTPGPSAEEEWKHQRVPAFGLNHLAFRVESIGPALSSLQDQGDLSLVVQPYEFAPNISFVEGVHHARLAAAARPQPDSRWKLAVIADPDGTLIEIVER